MIITDIVNMLLMVSLRWIVKPKEKVLLSNSRHEDKVSSELSQQSAWESQVHSSWIQYPSLHWNSVSPHASSGESNKIQVRGNPITPFTRTEITANNCLPLSHPYFHSCTFYLLETPSEWVSEWVFQLEIRTFINVLKLEISCLFLFNSPALLLIKSDFPFFFDPAATSPTRRTKTRTFIFRIERFATLQTTAIFNRM